MGASVAGERACIAAFKRTPEVAKDRLGEATDQTTFAILQRQRATVAVLSGALKAALDRSYSKATGIGKVGIRLHAVGRAGRANPAAYGHVIEFGSATASAHPFAIPAAEAEKGPYLARCRTAGTLIERDLSTVGGSFV